MKVKTTTKSNKGLIIGIVAFIVCIVLIGLLPSSDEDEAREGEAKVPASYDSLIEMNYETAQGKFEDSGFTNIKLEPIEDLITGWLTDDGDVESVTIDGSTEFTSGDWYPNDVEVIIQYHTFPPENENEDSTDEKSEEADSNNDTTSNEVVDTSDDENVDDEDSEEEENVPLEYRNALATAQTYAETMAMSKKAIYNQLVSEYGENFEKDAAQYAVDNLKGISWKENALKTARTYSETMNMSKAAIYDQLISDYGEQFTKKQAQYAIDHLE